MHCLKCGNRIQDGQVFCSDCLDVMATHPIAPGTPVKILHRPIKQPEKKAKEIPPAVQIRQVKRKNRRLGITVAVLLVIIGLLTALVVLHQKAEGKPPIGRNYTVTPH